MASCAQGTAAGPAIRLAVQLAYLLCPCLTSASTRYLPSSDPGPWLPMATELSSHALLSSLLSSSSLSAADASSRSRAVPAAVKDLKSELVSPFSPAPSLTSSSSPSSPAPSTESPAIPPADLFAVSKSSGESKSRSAARSLHKDLVRLSRLLPGTYTNAKQYFQDAGRPLPSDKRHVLLRSAYRQVEVPFLPQAFSVLVQDYSGDSFFPFRQRVHTFSVDPPHRAIRMKVWNFASPRVEKRATKNLDYFTQLRRKDLVSQGACDMFWRRLNRKTFVGITSRECLGYVHGEKVRITVSTTLTSHLLQTNEGWYRARDGQKLVEIDVPYNMVRTKGFPDPHREESHSEQKSNGDSVDSNHNELPTNPTVSSFSGSRDKLPAVSIGNSLPSIEEAETKSRLGEKKSKMALKHSSSGVEDELSQEEEKREKDKEWVLKDFDAISEALYTGRMVFYNVELTACALPPQNKVERFSFGDFIDDFEITPRDKKQKKKASVRFWQTKYIQGEESMEELIREITVLSNGRVLVRLIRKHSISEKVAWDHVAQCKLYDPETGLGGVKFTSQPSAEVQEITTYGRLRAALRRGRRQVRMILDLAQCEGRTHGSRPLIGFTVRAYDYINSGKAIEITRLTQDATHPGRQLFTGHFLQNGEVIFITSPQPASVSSAETQLPFPHRDATHRCALTSSDVRSNSWPSGVRLFYT